MRIVRGVTRNPAAREAFALRHGIELVTRYDEVLADPRVDAVILATPHSLHAGQIVAAARAGKHVFCEKPLTLTRVDALRAVAACDRAGRVLAVGHDKRFWSSMTALRRAVTEGVLGQLMHVEGHSSNEISSTVSTTWRHRREESPGGGMTGTGIHVLDAFVSVAGPVARVSAQLLTRRSGDDPRDTVSALLQSRTGVSGTVCAVRTTPFYWRVHAFGDEASAEVLGETTLVLRRKGGSVERRELEPTDSVRAEMDAFAESVTNGAPYPISPEEMIGTIAAFEAVMLSLETGTPVAVEAAGGSGAVAEDQAVAAAGHDSR